MKVNLIFKINTFQQWWNRRQKAIKLMCAHYKERLFVEKSIKK